jgi:molybdopterin molybdotransferase
MNATLEQIAAGIQGYDPKALPIPAAQAFIARLVQPVTQTERVSILAALGRVLARDVVSAFDVPPHDNSAMDGFAFRGAELATVDAVKGELRLRIAGTSLAGQPYARDVPPGQALRITTGAVMPAGLDTVVPQEFTRVEQDGQGDCVVFAARVVRTGDNRRFRGEDLAAGKPAVAAGRILRPAELGLIASLGIGEVDVFRRLRVAYFSTGDEIHSIGETLAPGGVYDSNRYTVHGMLQRLGIEVLDMGVVRDDPAALEAAFTKAASEADAVITSGGVSVGEADHTKQIMARLGDVVFWRIAMRPGRPMAIGRIRSSSQDGDAVLFGLPGNPVAVMVAFYAMVRDALLAMAGAKVEPMPMLRAACVTAVRKKPGRTEYQRGTVRRRADGNYEVEIIGNQGSGVLSSMSIANGLIVLPHEGGDVAAGDLVSVWPFEGLS